MVNGNRGFRGSHGWTKISRDHLITLKGSAPPAKEHPKLFLIRVIREIRG